MNKGVEKGRDLDDAEVLQVVASLVKQRRDSIEQFSEGRPHRSGGQGDRRDRRARGSTCRRRHRAEEIDAAVAAAIAETGATLAEGHGQGDEGRDAEAGRQERRRASRQRSRPPQAWRLSRSSPSDARALGRVGRRRDDDEPRPRRRPRAGARVALRRQRRDGRLQRRLPHSQSAPRSVRRRRDERRVRADVHAHIWRPTARSRPGGSATT